MSRVSTFMSEYVCVRYFTPLNRSNNVQAEPSGRNLNKILKNESCSTTDHESGFFSLWGIIIWHMPVSRRKLICQHFRGQNTSAQECWALNS